MLYHTQVGNAEMATDQFGSGGGFSKMFNQDDAKYQSAAVAKYFIYIPLFLGGGVFGSVDVRDPCVGDIEGGLI